MMRATTAFRDNRVVLFYVVFLSVICSILLVDRSIVKSFQMDSTFTGNISALDRLNSQKLADGCYNIFLDVGANIGVHGRFLFEPESYPNATKARAMFDRAFGANRDNRHFCVFAFEPNPVHRQRLKLLERVYMMMGWRYHPIFVGVSDEDGQMRFYNRADKEHNDWGFGATRKIADEKVAAISIPVVRLASWIKREIDGRKLPQGPEIRFNQSKWQPPKVVMKLDVEGLETRVISDLITSGVFCQIDYVFGEMHYQPQFYPMHLRDGMSFNKSGDARDYVNGLDKLLSVSKHCNTFWEREDDESHLNDGIPFPIPPSKYMSRKD